MSRDLDPKDLTLRDMLLGLLAGQRDLAEQLKSIPQPVRLVGKRGNLVEVSKAGELVVGQFQADQSKFVELAEDNTAYNFYIPLDGQQFCITAMRAKADRDVNNTVDATVIVYEAEDQNTTTVDKVLHQEAMVRGESFTITGLTLLVNKAKFVNAKTTDDDIHMTIWGFYLPTR